MKQMYFRTDYKDTLLPSGALLMKAIGMMCLMIMMKVI